MGRVTTVVKRKTAGKKTVAFVVPPFAFIVLLWFGARAKAGARAGCLFLGFSFRKKQARQVNEEEEGTPAKQTHKGKRVDNEGNGVFPLVFRCAFSTSSCISERSVFASFSSLQFGNWPVILCSELALLPAYCGSSMETRKVRPKQEDQSPFFRLPPHALFILLCRRPPCRHRFEEDEPKNKGRHQRSMVPMVPLSSYSLHCIPVRVFLLLFGSVGK